MIHLSPVIAQYIKYKSKSNNINIQNDLFFILENKVNILELKVDYLIQQSPDSSKNICCTFINFIIFTLLIIASFLCYNAYIAWFKSEESYNYVSWQLYWCLNIGTVSIKTFFYLLKNFNYFAS